MAGMKQKARLINFILCICMLLSGCYVGNNLCMEKSNGAHDFPPREMITNCSETFPCEAMLFDAVTAPVPVEAIRFVKRKAGNFSSLVTIVLVSGIPVLLYLHPVTHQTIYLFIGLFTKRFSVIKYIHNQDGKKPAYLFG